MQSRVAKYCKRPWTLSLGACKNMAVKFTHLRESLIQKLTSEVQEPGSEHLIEQAVTDAEALAWSTPYPLLFLPALAEEKVAGARRWADHQRMVLERQRELVAIL